MLILRDRPDPQFLFAGIAGGPTEGAQPEHVWLGLLTPLALGTQHAWTDEQNYAYANRAGQPVLDTVLQAIATPTGGAVAPGVVRRLSNGARSSLALHKDPSFRLALRNGVPQGTYCLTFRQTLSADNCFHWSVDPSQTQIDATTGQQRIGPGTARFPLNEATHVHVARGGLYRAWHVKVI
jgi:hypothetical protein